MRREDAVPGGYRIRHSLEIYPFLYLANLAGVPADLTAVVAFLEIERTGVTLVKYINTLRMEKARTMLSSEPDKNISEISDACGFQDSSYFTRVFRLMTGFSPTRYRIISVRNPENNP